MTQLKKKQTNPPTNQTNKQTNEQKIPVWDNGTKIVT